MPPNLRMKSVIALTVPKQQERSPLSCCFAAGQSRPAKITFGPAVFQTYVQTGSCDASTPAARATAVSPR